MAQRVSIDDPGVMDAILEDIKTRPREYWLGFLTRYENQKPGDIILPGVQPHRPAAENRAEAVAVSHQHSRAKKPARKQREAA